MKTSIKSFVSLCALYLLTAGLVFAQSADIYILDEGCGVLDENANGAVLPGDGIAISANSANGNITFTCSLDQARPASGRSVIFNYDVLIDLGFSDYDAKCGVGSERTKDWHQVISASGKTKLTCHYKE